MNDIIDMRPFRSPGVLNLNSKLDIGTSSTNALTVSAVISGHCFLEFYHCSRTSAAVYLSGDNAYRLSRTIAMEREPIWLILSLGVAYCASYF